MVKIDREWWRRSMARQGKGKIRRCCY